MTPAKVIEAFGRVPDCAGQTTGAVSAYTQVKMEDAPRFFCLIQNSRVRMSINVWIRLLRHKWPESWSNIEDPVVPLERNLCGHPLAGVGIRG